MPEHHDRPLKQLIERSDETQSSIARLLNVSIPQVNKWCNRGDPNAASLIRLANVLKCSTDAILGRSLSSVGTPELMAELGRRTAK